ncbi:MAG: M15 family metallopeptidase, partial [Saprospiraceae bacterium]
MNTKTFFTGSAATLLLFFTGCGAEVDNAKANRPETVGPPARREVVIGPARAAETGPPRQTEQPVSDSAPEAYGVAYLMGKFDPTKHPDFVLVSKPYTDRPGMLLRREAFEAFKKMWDAAHADGVHLKIISSTRTFLQQKAIWEAKWARFAKDAPAPQARAKKILEYSAMPGASRHHWGADMDLNDLNNPAFEQNGTHAGVYEWLQKNAHHFGYCQPYTPMGSDRPHGYNEEKWHWSYTPLSAPMLESYTRQINDPDITGFLGAETAQRIGIVQHYVQGIN